VFFRVGCRSPVTVTPTIPYGKTEIPKSEIDYASLYSWPFSELNRRRGFFFLNLINRTNISFASDDNVKVSVSFIDLRNVEDSISKLVDDIAMIDFYESCDERNRLSQYGNDYIATLCIKL